MSIKAAFLAATALFASSAIAAPDARAEFLWMQYEGSTPSEDGVLLGKNEFRNPILPGFAPDPSSLILKGEGANFIGQRQRHRNARVLTEVRYGL